MNNVNLIGRLTRDADIRYTSGGIAIANFSIAVNRRIRKDSNEQEADFISCVAFGKTAELIEKYVNKGNRIGVVGRIQTGKYENKDGKTVYTTDVIVENLEFLEYKTNSDKGVNEQNQNNKTNADGFMFIPDNIEDEGLPFA